MVEFPMLRVQSRKFGNECQLWRHELCVLMFKVIHATKKYNKPRLCLDIFVIVERPVKPYVLRKPLGPELTLALFSHCIPVVKLPLQKIELSLVSVPHKKSFVDQCF